MRMEEKPKLRLMTVSTGEADPTGLKRPHRLAFCTSQQREAFSAQHEGRQSVWEKLKPRLETLRDLPEPDPADRAG